MEPSIERPKIAKSYGSDHTADSTSEIFPDKRSLITNNFSASIFPGVQFFPISEGFNLHNLQYLTAQITPVGGCRLSKNYDLIHLNTDGLDWIDKIKNFFLSLFSEQNAENVLEGIAGDVYATLANHTIVDMYNDETTFGKTYEPSQKLISKKLELKNQVMLLVDGIIGRKKVKDQEALLQIKIQIEELFTDQKNHIQDAAILMNPQLNLGRITVL